MNEALTDDTLSNHILKYYLDLITSITGLRVYLLKTYKQPAPGRFREAYTPFFESFVGMYEITSPLPQTEFSGDLKQRIQRWIRASEGIITSKNSKNRRQHARDGLELAQEWTKVLHDKEIIKNTRL